MPSSILWFLFAFAAVVMGIHLVQVSCKFQMQSPQATPCLYFHKIKIFLEENYDFCQNSFSLQKIFQGDTVDHFNINTNCQR